MAVDWTMIARRRNARLNIITFTYIVRHTLVSETITVLICNYVVLYECCLIFRKNFWIRKKKSLSLDVSAPRQKDSGRRYLSRSFGVHAIYGVFYSEILFDIITFVFNVFRIEICFFLYYPFYGVSILVHETSQFINRHTTAALRKTSKDNTARRGKRTAWSWREGKRKR